MFFETIRCDKYEIFNLEYHNKRVLRTIGRRIDLIDYITLFSDELQKCKVTYNIEGVVDVSFSNYQKREIKSFKVVYDDTIEYSKKSIDRKRLDELFKKRGDSDEVMIVKNGVLTDTSIANIAIFLDNEWITPKKPLLLGTTRQRLLDNGVLKEGDIDVNMLKKAKKIALLNAMVGFSIVEEFEIFF